MRNRSILCALAAVLIAASIAVLRLTSVTAKKAAAEVPADAGAADLTVHFFDAGKADAVLLTTEHGAVLIDAGETGFGRTVLSYLEERGIEKLDCLIVTHFDRDHVGGAAAVGLLAQSGAAVLLTREGAVTLRSDGTGVRAA